jgi:tetratricopeptide (TPR) repeat protein
MTASGRRLTNGLLAGLVLLLAGCVTAYQHGQAALHDGRYLEAAARFSEALAEDPASVNALLGLGLAQYHLDSFQTAVGFLGRTVLAVPAHAEARLYLALTYLALEDQGAAARHLEAVAGLGVHPRTAAQASRAAALLHRGPLSIEIRELVRKSLENEADWHRDVIEARLAPHLYLGPAWFSRDPAGWSPLGWYPYGVPPP